MDQPSQKLDNELTEQLAAPFAGDAALLASVQRLAGIGMLTTGIAQELANLLSVVTAATVSLRHELSFQEGLEDEATQHYMNLIERNTFRCAQIVSILQEYGAADAQHLAITDVETILRDTLMLVEWQFREENNIGIKVHTPGGTRSLVCDHNRIIQLLVNLLNYARSTMQDPGGLILVTVDTLKNGEAKGFLKEGAQRTADVDHIAITVSEGDSTPVAELADRTLQPFATSSSGDNGVGLGLNVAREIARQHNGDIYVANGIGPAEGAFVTVLLPVRPAP